jgi:hypothetical protein
VALALGAIGIMSPIALPADSDDDWDAVPSPSSAGVEAPAPPVTPPRHSPQRYTRDPVSPVANGAVKVVLACGERALPASAKIQGIVTQINGVWGSNVRVYQSVAVEGPHAMGGGCIFYSPTGLAILLGSRLSLNDPAVFTPMLYAIFAHEVGHEDHRDFDPSRAAVPNQIKELEADRFSGYTMKKLDVPATGLSPYWSMTGDEFSTATGHGSSAQRVAAFKEGWHEAEWNRAETSESVTAATQESIAPDDSTAAP